MIVGSDQKGPGLWWYSLSGRPEKAEEVLATKYPRHGEGFRHGDVQLTVTTAQGNTVVVLKIDHTLSQASEQLSALRQEVRTMFGG